MDYPVLSEPLAGVPDEELELAMGVVRGYCRWHIAPVISETFTLDGTGSSTIILPTLSLRRVVELRIKGEPVEVGPYDWSEAGIILHHCTPCTPRSVEVTVEHGFDRCPVDILAVLKRLYRTSEFAGLTQASTLSNSYSIASPNEDTGMDPYVSAILDRYRLPARA